jgi:hypothetical protein
MRLDFRHTKRALAEYDRRMEELDCELEAAKTDEDVERWRANVLIALAGVREAFYLDTSDRNSWETCQSVSVNLARRMVELYT